jgi:hypothetical protein
LKIAEAVPIAVGAKLAESGSIGLCIEVAAKIGASDDVWSQGLGCVPFIKKRVEDVDINCVV